MKKLFLLTICLIVLSSCRGGGVHPIPPQPPTPLPTPNISVNQQLLDAHNKIRQSQGLTSWTTDDRLLQAAVRHANDMAANNFLSHTGSDGSSDVDRAQAAGYTSTYIGENIAEGGLTVDATMNMWMESPPHRQNILDSHYTQYAGASATSAGGIKYWVSVFASPD